MSDLISKIMEEEQIRQERIQQKVKYTTRKIVKYLLYKQEKERKTYPDIDYMREKNN